MMTIIENNVSRNLTEAERQQMMYGCTEAELESIEDDVICKGTVVLGMMSDAQQEMEFGQNALSDEERDRWLERARQTLNRAKWMAHRQLPKDEHGRLL